MPDIMVLIGYISALVLIFSLARDRTIIEKKYNDLRVENARLKSKVGK